MQSFTERPRLLRLGHITREQYRRVIPVVAQATASTQAADDEMLVGTLTRFATSQFTLPRSGASVAYWRYAPLKIVHSRRGDGRLVKPPGE